MTKSDPDPLYELPDVYEAFWGSPGDDLPYYISQALSAHGPVLDLATGAGRVALAMAREGAAVTGVDRSPAMLAAARAAAQTRSLDVRFVQGDLRSLSLDGRFALAVLPYNGLQHLHDGDDLDAFFRGLRAHLAPAGRFALDVHLPQALILSRDPEEWFGVDPPREGAAGWQVLAERSAYDAGSQVLTQTWRLSSADGSTRDLSLGLRQFFPQELRRLLESQGFKVLRHDGGFQGQGLDGAALKQAVLAQLR